MDAIKDAITGLPQDAQVALAAWLNVQTMDAWDKEMQGDSSHSGRGHYVVERVAERKPTEMNDAFGVTRLTRSLIATR